MGSIVEKPKQKLVWVELNPASGVDILGDAPLLVAGVAGEFTKSEAAELCKLVNEHGTPLCRIVDVVGA